MTLLNALATGLLAAVACTVTPLLIYGVGVLLAVGIGAGAGLFCAYWAWQEDGE